MIQKCYTVLAFPNLFFNITLNMVHAVPSLVQRSVQLYVTYKAAVRFAGCNK